MLDAKAVLTGWIVEYLKSRDALTKQITGIRNNEDGVDVVIDGNLKTQFVLVQPALSSADLLSAFQDKHLILVTANTKENLEFLISNWDSFVKFPHLSVYFVNPESSLDKRWIIYPFTHSRITERNALRKGIESMFSTVEPWKE